MAQAAKNSKAEKVADSATADKSYEKATAVTTARFQLAAEMMNRWVLTCTMETTPEQVMDESYWANISMLLAPGDEIVVRPDDMAWELVLHVAGCGNLWAHVVKKALYNLKALVAPITVPSKYKVEFAGSHHKWRVLREGNMLKDGFATEGLARRYAANHEAAVLR